MTAERADRERGGEHAVPRPRPVTDREVRDPRADRERAEREDRERERRDRERRDREVRAARDERLDRDLRRMALLFRLDQQRQARHPLPVRNHTA